MQQDQRASKNSAQYMSSNQDEHCTLQDEWKVVEMMESEEELKEKWEEVYNNSFHASLLLLLSSLPLTYLLVETEWKTASSTASSLEEAEDVLHCITMPPPSTRLQVKLQTTIDLTKLDGKDLTCSMSLQLQLELAICFSTSTAKTNNNGWQLSKSPFAISFATVRLSSLLPSSEPDAALLSSAYTSKVSKMLKLQLEDSYSLWNGGEEMSICEAVQWVVRYLEDGEAEQVLTMDLEPLCSNHFSLLPVNYVASIATTELPCATITNKVDRQWLLFIGFYSLKIREQFVSRAADFNINGFLMSGKPAVSCLEGKKDDIKAFVKCIRTDVFATVSKSARKMNLVYYEANVTASFAADPFFETQFHCPNSSHKRKDLADIGLLRTFLAERNCEHVFSHIFDDCL